MEWESVSGIGYRAMWKLLELLTIVILFRWLGDEEFALGYIAVVITWVITTLLQTYPRSGKEKETRQFYNTIAIIYPIAGIIIAALVGALSLFDYYPHIFQFSAAYILIHSFAVTPITFFSSRRDDIIYKSNLIAQVLMIIISFSLAFSDKGKYSVLYGYVAYYLFSMLFYWKQFPLKISLDIDLSSLAYLVEQLKDSLLNYGSLIIINYIPLIFAAYFFFAQFPTIYVAFMIGYFLYENITVYFNALLLPKFHAMKKEQEQLRYSIIKYMEYTAFITLPFLLILLLLNGTIMHIVFQVKTNSVVMLIILSGMLKTLFHTIRIVFIIEDKIHIIIKNRFIESIALLTTLALTSSLGLLGIGIAVLISTIVSCGLYIYQLNGMLKIDLIVISKDYLYILIAGILTGLVVGFLSEIMSITTLPGLLFVCVVSLGVYFALTYVFNSNLFRNVIRFLFTMLES